VSLSSLLGSSTDSLTSSSSRDDIAEADRLSVGAEMRAYQPSMSYDPASPLLEGEQHVFGDASGCSIDIEPPTPLKIPKSLNLTSLREMVELFKHGGGGGGGSGGVVSGTGRFGRSPPTWVDLYGPAVAQRDPSYLLSVIRTVFSSCEALGESFLVSVFFEAFIPLV
jgi:hypothetical protein